MRRILLFPLTRLIIALCTMAVVGLPLSLVVFGLLGLPQLMFLGELVMSLAALGALLFVGKIVERRSLSEFGLGLRGAGRELAQGFALGAGLISAIIGVLALAGWYQILAINRSIDTLITSLIFFFLVAVFEEVAFRGILFRIVEEGLGSWLALAISAAAFGLIHLGNPGASLFAAIAIALEAGVLLGAAYMLTRNLWLAIGVHWSWNFFEGPIFGAPVSGLNQQPLIEARFPGPDLWTGGAFGPEAGIAALLVATLAGIVLLVLAVRGGRVITPHWMRRRADRRHEPEPIA